MDSSLRSIPKKEPKIETSEDPRPSPASITKALTLTLIPPSSQPNPPPLQALAPDLPAEIRHVTRPLHYIPPSTSASAASTAARTLSRFPMPSNPRKRPIFPGRSGDLRRVTDISPHDLVLARDLYRRTRILYESIRTHLHETRDSDPLCRRSRAHHLAAQVMREANLWLNRENRTCGFIPGLEMGDIFFYRMELCMLGLHGQVQGGIDFLVASQSPNGESIATSVVISGGYEDDQDFGDVIVYTGQGGREGKNETRHSVNQKLEGGNLALERSCYHGIEIRVFRGLDCDRSPTNRVYVYDGLFQVVKCWTEMGKSGFLVYKFELVRLGGQQEMGSVVLKLAEDLKKMEVSRNLRNGYLSHDISRGKERQPVSLFNDIDADRDPLNFAYVVRPTFQSFALKDMGGKGCKCIYDCSVNCACTKRNGGELVFDSNGRLLRGKGLVYECGRSCRCPSSCANKVSQKGLNLRLEVFRSNETHWGVRSLDVIHAGQFVCEISGIILTKEEAEFASSTGKSLFYPNKMPRRWKEWGDLSKVRMDNKRDPMFPLASNVEYAIDVSKVRNVGCYLSHSCNPNVFLQYVLFNHYNEEYPRLMVFALENIPPLRELSLDYGLEDLM